MNRMSLSNELECKPCNYVADRKFLMQQHLKTPARPEKTSEKHD